VISNKAPRHKILTTEISVPLHSADFNMRRVKTLVRRITTSITNPCTKACHLLSSQDFLEQYLTIDDIHNFA
jgi:hypothetical protein